MRTTHIEKVIKETLTLDSPELRAVLDAVLTELAKVLTNEAIDELPSAYILNLAVLKETKNITADLVVRSAMAYALDNNKASRSEITKFLNLQHFVLDSKVPTTTH